MTTIAFLRHLSQTYTTKRATVSGGKRGSPSAYLAGVKGSPLDRTSPEVQARLMLDAPMVILQTFVLGSVDITPGDVLVSGTTDYQVRAVELWTDSPVGEGDFKTVYVEMVKP
jgi:hypothetical protein